ncbi:NADH dehydrogenase [ubiquinone] 1 beta subcomplex subunit 4 [Genypterus blacodes]|uniref:NADH dehydrogenase [ubiquinone] 1 beta subcomplex subunit 4 n=1 Tax=Genypterus blacodes TaxID=154954 RepID=UPI003F7704A2
MAKNTGMPLPKTLDPSEYFDLSPESRRAEEERAAIRANLKRQYQTQLNNPHRRELIEDPALNRWVYARGNPLPHFKFTARTSFFSGLFGVAPILFFWYLFKTDRDKKEEQIKAGTYKRPFSLAS